MRRDGLLALFGNRWTGTCLPAARPFPRAYAEAGCSAPDHTTARLPRAVTYPNPEDQSVVEIYALPDQQER